MSDLIDRQAAIDAAIEAADSWDGFCSIGQQKLIENYINSLPFAPGVDLVSRWAVIDICANVIDLFRGQFGAGVLVAIKESIEELPSAQPEPKKGKWIGYNTDKEGWNRTDGSPVFMSCSECGGTVLNNGSAHWNYCPNCGADMRGGQDE